MTDDTRKVGGPVPLNVATESVLFGGMLEEKVQRVMLTAAAVALCWWMARKR